MPVIAEQSNGILNGFICSKLGILMRDETDLCPIVSLHKYSVTNRAAEIILLLLMFGNREAVTELLIFLFYNKHSSLIFA